MASRRERKEELRRERERREAAARGGEGRRRLIGYAAAAAIVVAAIAVAAVLLAGGEDGGGDASADVLPDGGSYPEPRDAPSVGAAARAAGCELDSYRVKGRSPHSLDPNERIEWPTEPPAGGRHYQEWADDGAYGEAPNVNMLVHSLEHGRVIVWFRKSLSADRRAALKAYFEDDSYQLILTPDETGSQYAVSATAWTREPAPQGTGRLLGCPSFDDDVFTALEAFKDEYRSRGPEAVP